MLHLERFSFTRVLLASTALSSLGLFSEAARAQSLPTGASVAFGAVGFQRSSGTLTINQSSQTAIVNYNSFSIGRRNTVNINQPNSSSALLNRVTGNTPSTIAGRLNANGQVYLINPNGIAITKTGVVKVGGGFVASTLGMSDQEFRSGRRQFRGNGASAGVSNAGTITIGRGGYAALIGGEVRNSGTIAVPMGKVGLGSGEMATLDVSGDGFLQVALPSTRSGNGALVSNSGLIAAAGGTVVLDAATARAAARQAVNISGTVDAHSISGHSGAIILGGGGGGTVNVSGTLNVSGGTRTAGGTVRVSGRKVQVSGTIDASGRRGGSVTLAAADGTRITGTIKTVGHRGRGGAVTITGLRIALKGGTVNASGETGGGTVKIGGDLHGAGTLPHAKVVTIDANSVITADATGKGNGGSVVVWSDKTTSFAGLITARGGAQGGDGGSAEVSSHGLLSYTGSTVLTAAHGAMGTLLLDPYNITISDAADSGSPLVYGVGLAAQTSNINITTLATALNSANVALSTGAANSVGTDAGNITLSSASGATLAWTSSATLTLTAANAIALNAPISAAAGGLILNAGTSANPGAITATGAISLARFTLQAGNWSQNTATLPAFSAGDFELPGGTFVRATGGGGTAAAPYTLTDIYGVQGIGTSATFRAASYQLAANIDAGQTATWNAGAGFVPVGTNTNAFTGSLNGAGYAISNLTINRPTTNYVGLVGALGTGGSVSNLGLVGGSVSGRFAVGELVGYNNGGTITAAYATGNVSGSFQYIGGFVGDNNSGMIIQSYATGAVSGPGQAMGGLVGYNGSGTISQSYATGNVTSQGLQYVGGLVGSNNTGTISQSYATGSVTAPSTNDVGGLVGVSSAGTIAQSYATGAVSGNQFVGGLIGYNYAAVTQSYASGAVSGSTQVGGLLGLNGSSNVTNSYWDKQTSGQPTIGVGAGSTTGVTGLTTTQARTASSYTGFDFTNTWYQAGDMRPILRSEAAPAVNGIIPVFNLHQLALIGASATSLAGSYQLANNIDATETQASVAAGTAGTNTAGVFGPSGFVPVGTDNASFTGALNGAGHTITGLTINQSTVADVGLIGQLGDGGGDGIITGIGLTGGSVTGTGIHVGGLVGVNNGGTISQVYNTGAVIAGSSSEFVGGLVGYNTGNVSQAYSTGTVTANFRNEYVGGLVGANNGSISQAYSTGAVTDGSYVGGLVGFNGGSVSQAYSTGAVTADPHNLAVGGLVGDNNGSISQAYSTGAVTTGSGSSDVGGLVGENIGPLTATYWDMQTSGQTTGVGLGPSVGATGLTTAQARTQAGYTNANDATQNFDFTNVWYQAGDLRPILRSEAAPAVNGVIPISNLHQLQLMGANLAGSYQLANTIDASGSNLPTNTSSVFGPGGFVPVGDGNTSFTGALNGAGYTVSGLTINRPSQDYVGLIGVLDNGSITSVGLVGGSVTGHVDVGGLVGDNAGLLVGDYNAGTVTGVGGGYNTGGLVGENEGSITRSYTTGAVSGLQTVGGLVGGNYSGMISLAYATGTVSSTGQFVGGLLGANFDTVTNVYATGTVSGGSGSSYVGGLVGYNAGGTISQAYATGATTGGSYVGGLTGYNNATLRSTYWNKDNTTIGVGRGSATGATGRTTLQMQDLSAYQTNFAGFDFANVWSPPNQVGQNNGSASAYYPQLYALGNITTVAPTGSRPYGAANATAPSLYYGVHAGDFVTTPATLSNAATTTSAPGAYAGSTDAGAVTTSDGSLTTAAGATYRYVYLPTGTLTVTPAVIYVTGETGVNKTYNGTASVAAGTTPFIVVNPVNGVTVTDASATYGNGRNAGAAESIAVAGLATNNANYVTSTTTLTSSGTISPEAITVTAATNTKTYDGTTTAAAMPTVTAGMLYDPATFAETYNNANAGTGKVLTPTATISDGNNGANYAVTYVANTMGVINARPVTLSGSQVYDGTTNAPAANLTVTNLVGGDNAGLTGTGTLAGRNAGSETLTSTNSALTGLAVSNANYTVTGGSGSVSVTAEAITVTAAANTKTYDGTVSAAAMPTVTAGMLYDTATFAETYNNANAGTGKVLTPTATINDGNNGANYAVTYVANTMGVINARPVMLSGTQVYDGTTNAPAANLTVTNLVGGDNAGLTGTGTLASRNAGSETLTSTNSALTGLAVSNANYTVTGGSGSVSVTAEAITVTAATNTKTYDGTVSAAATPTVTAGMLYDPATFAETYNNANAGTGKVLTPTATISDGNNGANYAVTYVANTMGVINARPVTLSGTQVYDGTTNAPAANLTVTNLVSGDNAGLTGTGTLVSRNAGSETLTSTNSALTGLAVSNANYTVAGGNGSVSVTAEAITVTAAANTKTYDGTVSAAAMPTVTAGMLYDTATFAETYNNANAGTGKVLTPTATINDGNNGANYAVTLVSSSNGVINPAMLTYVAAAASRSYGAASPALSGTVTGFVAGQTQQSATTGTLAFTTAATAASNVGRYAITGSGLTANNGDYVLAQGAGNATALTINPALLSVSGAKTYDTTTGFATGQFAVAGGGERRSGGADAGDRRVVIGQRRQLCRLGTVQPRHLRHRRQDAGLELCVAGKRHADDRPSHRERDRGHGRQQDLRRHRGAASRRQRLHHDGDLQLRRQRANRWRGERRLRQRQPRSGAGQCRRTDAYGQRRGQLRAVGRKRHRIGHYHAHALNRNGNNLDNPRDRHRRHYQRGCNANPFASRRRSRQHNDAQLREGADRPR